MPFGSENTFRFKQFEVRQASSAMKVGTDAVLLASWVDLSGFHHILDVGTGTGVIALMCAQKNPSAQIEAIDIHEGSVDDARFNFAQSPWSDRLKVYQGDFLKIVSGEKFDLIISNPPYFSHSLRAADPGRNAARHDDTLPADAFLKLSKKLLTPEGIVAVIIPGSQAERWLEEAAKCDLFPMRVCHVFTQAHKESAGRLMLELGFKTDTEPKMESLLIEKSPGEKSEAYKELTKAFYLKY